MGSLTFPKRDYSLKVRKSEQVRLLLAEFKGNSPKVSPGSRTSNGLIVLHCCPKSKGLPGSFWGGMRWRGGVTGLRLWPIGADRGQSTPIGHPR